MKFEKINESKVIIAANYHNFNLTSIAKLDSSCLIRQIKCILALIRFIKWHIHSIVINEIIYLSSEFIPFWIFFAFFNSLTSLFVIPYLFLQKTIKEWLSIWVWVVYSDSTRRASRAYVGQTFQRRLQHLELWVFKVWKFGQKCHFYFGYNVDLLNTGR